MTDARRIAKEPQPIVCVPTNHFREGTFPILKRDLRRLLGKISRPKRPAGDATEPAAAYTEWIVPLSLPVRFMRKLSSYLNGNVYISDIAQLDYGMLSLMMRSIRSRARKTGLTELPIILENHTKDIRDFSHIERFVADLAGAEDVKCITLTDLARKLVNEEFAIRSARKMDRTPIPRPTAQQV